MSFFFFSAFNWKATHELTLTDFYFVNFTFLGCFSLKIWSTFLHISFKCWFLGDWAVLQTSSSLIMCCRVQYLSRRGIPLWTTPSKRALSLHWPSHLLPVLSTTSPMCLVISRNGTIREITSPATWLWLQSPIFPITPFTWIFTSASARDTKGICRRKSRRFLISSCQWQTWRMKKL